MTKSRLIKAVEGMYSYRFGMKGKALAKSYLSNRCQFFCIDGPNSNCAKVVYGLPQRSVLGPLLYLLYTFPLIDIIRKHDMTFHFMQMIRRFIPHLTLCNLRVRQWLLESRPVYQIYQRERP